jgi:hypothetical protein
MSWNISQHPSFEVTKSDSRNFEEQNLADSKSNKIDSSKQIGFHTGFALLKKHLGITSKRKTHIDSLLKKCKSKCFKTIHEAVRQCLNCRVERLPQTFVTNIKIDYNKSFLDKTILQIYNEFGVLTSLSELIERKLIRRDKFEVFIEFISKPFRDIFESYITSKRFAEDTKFINQKEGDKFSHIFNYISTSFIKYYSSSKGNKPKSKLSPKKGQIFHVQRIDIDNTGMEI